LNLTPMARFVSYAVAGVSPNHGHRPDRGDSEGAGTPACNWADVDWIELNEAFAAQSAGGVARAGPGSRPRSIRWAGRSRWAIRWARPARFASPPWCMALRRHGLRYGMVTMCIGTGMGAAGVFEAL
jgi:acetyl-CoA acyltransferase